MKCPECDKEITKIGQMADNPKSDDKYNLYHCDDCDKYYKENPGTKYSTEPGAVLKSHTKIVLQPDREIVEGQMFAYDDWHQVVSALRRLFARYPDIKVTITDIGAYDDYEEALGGAHGGYMKNPPDSLKRQVLDFLGADDWTIDNGMLICPHGYRVEDDGKCPEGCVSPLLSAGMI